MQKKLTLSVGIPTCYGNIGLIDTISSIRKSKHINNFKIRIVADSVPFSAEIKQGLNNFNVDFTENSERGSQMKKTKQIIEACAEDIFVFTQDDVRFDENALHEIKTAFENDPQLTMIGSYIKPEPASTIFERIIEVGLRLVYRIGLEWNSKDNFLMSNGRCISFRTSFLKKFTIPEIMVNSDAYLYFENKRNGGKFLYLPESIVYNQSPQKLSEHIRQSNRFQYSFSEMSKFFKSDLSSEYKIPFSITLKSAVLEFISHPIEFVLYSMVQVIAQINKYTSKGYTNPLWKVNTSTKKHN